MFKIFFLFLFFVYLEYQKMNNATTCHCVVSNFTSIDSLDTNLDQINRTQLINDCRQFCNKIYPCSIFNSDNCGNFQECNIKCEYLVFSSGLNPNQ